MESLYVPYFDAGNCAYVYNENVIRVYDTEPTYNSTVHYIDYFYNSHYLSREGYSTFSNYSTLPVCHDKLNMNFYNRTDICEILVMFTIFVGFTWFLVSKLVKTLLRGGRIW